MTRPGTDYARQTANMLPFLWLVFGGVLGAAASLLYAELPGRALLAAGAASAVLTAALRGSVRRSARVATGAGLASMAFVALSFAAVGAAAATGLVGPAAGLLVFVGAVALLAAGTDRLLPRRAAEWERERAHNLTRALDRERATYAFGADRGFRYATGHGHAQVAADRPTPAALWPWAGAAAALAAGLPVLFGRSGSADPRAFLVLLLGPPLAVCFAPVLATLAHSYRALVAYERELGREITNV